MPALETNFILSRAKKLRLQTRYAVLVYGRHVVCEDPRHLCRGSLFVSPKEDLLIGMADKTKGS